MKTFDWSLWSFVAAYTHCSNEKTEAMWPRVTVRAGDLECRRIVAGVVKAARGKTGRQLGGMLPRSLWACASWVKTLSCNFKINHAPFWETLSLWFPLKITMVLSNQASHSLTWPTPLSYPTLFTSRGHISVQTSRICERGRKIRRVWKRNEEIKRYHEQKKQKIL